MLPLTYRFTVMSTVGALTLVAACSDDDDSPAADTIGAVDVAPADTTATADVTAPTASAPDATPATSATSATSATTAATAATSGTGPATAAPPAATGGDDTSVLTARAGTWLIGDAGEVEVELTDGALALVDVRANEGWRTVTEVDDAREIEVDFFRDNVQRKFEIELDDGRLEVEIDEDIAGASPGRVAAGEAGEVEFGADGDTLRLLGVTESAGWTATVNEDGDDEIEVDFRNGAASYLVEIEIDDGVIDIEVDFTVEGPAAP